MNQEQHPIDKAVSKLTLKQTQDIIHGLLGILSYDVEVMTKIVCLAARDIDTASVDQRDNIQSAINLILGLDGVTMAEYRKGKHFIRESN